MCVHLTLRSDVTRHNFISMKPNATSRPSHNKETMHTRGKCICISVRPRHSCWGIEPLIMIFGEMDGWAHMQRGWSLHAATMGINYVLTMRPAQFQIIRQPYQKVNIFGKFFRLIMVCLRTQVQQPITITTYRTQQTRLSLWELKPDRSGAQTDSEKTTMSLRLRQTVNRKLVTNLWDLEARWLFQTAGPEKLVDGSKWLLNGHTEKATFWLMWTAS